MRIQIAEQPFDPWEALAAHQSGLSGFGATSVFVGTMREFNDSSRVEQMVLEHYPGMTEKHLRRICKQAAEKWRIVDALVIHRVGKVEPGDPIVLVAVWSGHRREAYEANRYIMEDLKSQAPFWKKETREDGEHWVQGNTPGY